MTANSAPVETGEPAPTEIRDPRRRAFLPQTIGERLGSFCWSIARVLLFRPSPFNWWRILLLRVFGASVHGSARIAPSVRVYFPWNLTIGRDVVIDHQVIINCMGVVEIGDETRVSPYAHLCAGTHDYRRRDMRIVRRPIHVGKGVWIATDAFVGPGVTLGDGCLLAARSSAFGNLPAGQVCIGEPARPRRPRFPA